MKREHVKELLPIIVAFANGEDVQFNNGLGWKSSNDLEFISASKNYRMAPKPRKVWVNEYPGNNTFYGYLTRQEADECADSSRIACHEIELPPLP
jgi:hypothetical protein